MKSELARFSNQDSGFNASGDTFNNINLSEEILVQCTQRVVQQHNFDTCFSSVLAVCKGVVEPR